MFEKDLQVSIHDGDQAFKCEVKTYQAMQDEYDAILRSGKEPNVFKEENNM